MENSNIPPARRRLARIRCLLDCIKSLQDGKPFPAALCYVPSETEYRTNSKVTWKLYEEPKKGSQVVKEVSATPSSRLIVSGEDFCNSDGKWLRVLRVKAASNETPEEMPGGHAWLLLYSSKSSAEETPVALPVDEDSAIGSKSKTTITNKKGIYKVKSWEAYIEETFSPLLKKHRAIIISCDEDAMKSLQTLGKDWSLEHDAALTQLMSKYLPSEVESVGSLRNYVEALDVSSYGMGGGEAHHLTDEDPTTYWETDGSQGQHWIRLRMKRGTIIKSLTMVVDMADDNYLPEHIVVLGGEPDDLKVLRNINLTWTTSSSTEIQALENLSEHYSVITIRIKACKAGGIDTRIRGIKMSCLEGKPFGFNIDFFSGSTLVRYPILQSYDPEVLYRRSITLERFMKLLDSVIKYLVPSWQCAIDSISTGESTALTNLETIRQLLPLSRKRLSLIDTLLRSSSSDLMDRKVIFINRHAALEQRANPTGDLKSTVFMQVYEGLRPKDRSYTPLNYRWPAHNEQWWECKFISEGIIDQGGGFRDSLSDIAEELCPSEPDAPLPLPYFIRAPNQENVDGNINKDVYIPNPMCGDFSKFEWIGQLMGACFRGKEILILSLAPYVWKRLNGEPCSWSKDFASVDAAEVKLIDNLRGMDKETFETAGRSWSLVQSDGSTVSLKLDEDGNPKLLKYEEREEYAEKVREIRMGECDKQLKAMKTGLLKVLPEAALFLLTWQELETRICGEPDISVEALMRSTYFHHLEEDDVRVKHFWAAMKNFSNEDRSRLLRFITGRRRLPVSIFLSSGKSNPNDPLPESATCCNTLHLPLYSSEKVAEEKLRYAAYNCVSIDTDE